MNITFCINTARNERYHLELLFRSLYKNLSRKDYDILVYVENDNQDTLGFLKIQKQNFPNLKIIVNPLPIPIGYARNINMMFDMAQTDVVSYLQSDMVICNNYDLEIIKHLTPDTIISATRIEPPLHPPSPEKITCDFGLDPKNFNLETFTSYAETQKKDEITDFWFAPFTLYKKNWVDIGGHDTLFRRSREDSDLLYRFSMKGLKIKQVWNALVYHFTCTSSRGPEWWKEYGKERAQLQSAADSIEVCKFLRKWPAFKHSTTFDPNTEFKYQISANFSNALPKDFDLLRQYYLFDHIYIDNPITRETIKKIFEEIDSPANSLLDIYETQWNYYKKYYRTWKYEDIFTEEPIVNDDIIYNINLNRETFGECLKVNSQIFIQRHQLIHANQSECPGEFEIEGTGIKITMNRAVNRIQENLIVKNPPLDDVMFQIF